MAAVTIVIPSYNHARFLTECLRTIQAQTFEDWQAILIDDGSRDESVEVAREFARREPRLRVEANPSNLGTYGTQQRGLDLSESEFVAVMNSDDRWAPTKLDRQVEALRRHPEASLTYVLGWTIDEGGREAEEDVHADWPRTEVQDILPYLLYENRVLASGVLFRRTGLRFETSLRYSGDWVSLIERSYTGPVVCVPERLTFWRQHDRNTYTISPRQMAEEIRVREAIASRSRDWSLARLDPSLVRRGLHRNAMNLFALRVFFHDFSGARRAGAMAVRTSERPKTALKRTLSSLLPAGYVRRYFWGRSGIDLDQPDRSTLRAMLAASPPLALLLEQSGVK